MVSEWVETLHLFRDSCQDQVGVLGLGRNGSQDQFGMAGRLGDMAQPGLDGLRTVAQADAWKWIALFLRLEAKLNNTRVSRGECRLSSPFPIV